MNISHNLRAISALAALALFTASLMAQTATTGLVRGAVTDTTGGVILGATVELTEVATGITARQLTNEIGQYIFPNVKPGAYILTVTAAGFRTFRVQQIRVEVTKSYEQDARLELGEVSETVTVEAEARVELQTVDSTLGNVISVKSLPALPLGHNCSVAVVFYGGFSPTAVTPSDTSEGDVPGDGIARNGPCS
ncbi:MAG: carboxypeptidase-like regulatory domain-containing protein, partial [Acidobacteriota bacterium]